jgi:hypothetical protein
MMISRAFWLSSLIALVAAHALPARALTVDLRDAAFAGADNQSSFTAVVDGLAVTTTALPHPDATLYWDGVDGFGVRYGYEADEIEECEVLRITFSEQVYIEAIHLTNLFYEDGYIEWGAYEVDQTGASYGFAALPSQGGGTNGERTVDVGLFARTIEFRAPGRWQDQGHEFSVAGIRYEKIVNPLPEPASIGLFAVGGMIAAGVLRFSRR